MTGIGPDERDDEQDALAGIEIPDDLSSLFDALPAVESQGPRAHPEDTDGPEVPRGSEAAADAAAHDEPDAARGAVLDAAAPDTADSGDPQPEGSEPPAGAADAEPEFVVPDDLGALTAQEVPSVALVVTQVAVPGPLAAVCALAKVDVDAVGSPIGAIAVLRDPADAATATRAVSQRLRDLPVVLLERRAERVTATQWSNGELVEELPSGLVLSDAPQVLEDLLLHDAPVDQLDGVVTSVGLSRWRAMRLLTSVTKKPKG